MILNNKVKALNVFTCKIPDISASLRTAHSDGVMRQTERNLAFSRRYEKQNR